MGTARREGADGGGTVGIENMDVDGERTRPFFDFPSRGYDDTDDDKQKTFVNSRRRE